MDTLDTKYGTLNGVADAMFYPGGCVETCQLEALNQISTLYGVLIPQYEEEDVRRKQVKPVSFHPNGNLATVSLQTQQAVQTPVGELPAEYLVFHESGSLKRVFPLNGKITGYWSEENEYDLAKELEIQVPFGTLKAKLMGVSFYESGAVKSLTFWPRDSVSIPTPIGLVETRTGVAFYPQGAIKSIEPNNPTLVETPIGKITAFHANVIGIHGDTNSLCFTEEGQVQALMTSTDHITVTDSQGNQQILKPGLQPSCNIEVMDIVPLRIEFDAGKVRFNSLADCEYELEQNTFVVEHLPLEIQNKCESLA